VLVHPAHLLMGASSSTIRTRFPDSMGDTKLIVNGVHFVGASVQGRDHEAAPDGGTRETSLEPSGHAFQHLIIHEVTDAIEAHKMAHPSGFLRAISRLSRVLEFPVVRAAWSLRSGRWGYG
jgi:hypothetical protein